LCSEARSGFTQMGIERIGASWLRRALSKTPFPRLDLRWEEIDGHRGRMSAVLVPLFPREEELFLLLVERSDSLKRHPGQVAFPGGAREKLDRGPVETALREFTEETGIPAERVEVVGALREVRVYSSGFTIFPVVGYLSSGVAHGDLSLDGNEVKRVLEVPLKQLERPPRMENPSGGGQDCLFPVYRLDGGATLWGASARIVLDLTRSLRESKGGTGCP